MTKMNAKIIMENGAEMVLELYPDTAPITVENFVSLAKKGFYDGLIFHRVIENFMIQGGDPNGDGTGSSPDKIDGEFISNGYFNPIKHEKGVISMARGNSMDSASCQFFICNSSSASVSGLDGKYAAFGHVVEGLEIVDKITEETAPYGDYNGTINNKKKQAVILEMMVIEYEENQ
jgi:peptidyl-prolyl cis-trans isomerase B (cyclophilin B)